MLDESLVARASVVATGATVHDVNAMIGAYRASHGGSWLSAGWDHSPGSPAWVAAEADRRWSRAILEEFVSTGDIKAAKKNHRRSDYIIAVRRELDGDV